MECLKHQTKNNQLVNQPTTTDWKQLVCLNMACKTQSLFNRVGNHKTSEMIWDVSDVTDATVSTIKSINSTSETHISFSNFKKKYHNQLIKSTLLIYNMYINTYILQSHDWTRKHTQKKTINFSGPKWKNHPRFFSAKPSSSWPTLATK